MPGSNGHSRHSSAVLYSHSSLSSPRIGGGRFLNPTLGSPKASSLGNEDALSFGSLSSPSASVVSIKSVEKHRRKSASHPKKQKQQKKKQEKKKGKGKKSENERTQHKGDAYRLIRSAIDNPDLPLPIQPLKTMRMISLPVVGPLKIEYNWPRPKLQTKEEIRRASKALNEWGKERGSLLLIRHTHRLFKYVIPVMILVSFFAGIVSSFCYNRELNGSDIESKIFSRIVEFFLSAPLAIIIIAADAFFFPVISKRTSTRIMAFIPGTLYVITYIIAYSFSGRISWWTNERSYSQKIASLVAEVFVLLFHFGFPEWCRMMWRKWKKEHLKLAVWPTFKQELNSQSGFSHTILVVLCVLEFALDILCILEYFPNAVAKGVLIIVIIIPTFACVHYKLKGTVHSWQSGAGMMFGTYAVLSGYGLSLMCFLLISFGGGTAVWNAIMIAAFYIVFGLVFKASETMLGRATEDYCAPQFMALSQVSFEIFTLVALVDSKYESTFWTSTLLYALVSLSVVTGFLSDMYLKFDNWYCKKYHPHLADYSKEELLQRMTYYFMRSIQSCIFSICGIFALFGLTIVDYFYSDPEECAMTCTKSESERGLMFVRIVALFVIDSLILLASLFSYSYKFTKFAYSVDSKNGEDPRQLAKLNVRFDPPQKVTWKLMKKTLSSMFYSILLHINRYNIFFIWCLLVVIFYVPFSSVYYLTPHKLLREGSSSSSFLSSFSLFI